MIIFKTLQYLFQPSFTILIIFTFGTFFLIRKKRPKIGLNLIIVGMILYYLISTPIIAGALISPLERWQKNDGKNQEAGIAVLLTGGREDNILRASEILRLYNFKKNAGQPLKIIISGINSVSTDGIIELDELSRYLKDNGVPKEFIVTDQESKTTWESAENIGDLIGQESFFLVTSAYHMPRAIMAFNGFNAAAIPMPTDYKAKADHNLFDLLPSGGALRLADLAVHEYLGLIFYKLKFLWKH